VTDFWSKGSKLRAETVVAGRRIVTLVNGDTYYAYDRLDSTGVAIARAASAIREDAKRSRPFGNELAVLVRQGAEHVKRERLGGRIVDLYRLTDALGKRQIWVTADPFELPVRVEIFQRQSGTTIQTDYLNWLHGLPIADSFFEPEPTLLLKHMSAQEYLTTSPQGGKLGPVPVLYSDLLVGH
jgi:outer membrane lipoprotein-sorting protein